MTYDQWKTTEPEKKPIWEQKGYTNVYDYITALDLGIEDRDETNE